VEKDNAKFQDYIEENPQPLIARASCYRARHLNIIFETSFSNSSSQSSSFSHYSLELVEATTLNKDDLVWVSIASN